MFRKIIFAAVAAAFVVSPVAAVAKSSHHSGAYENSFVPAYGYGSAQGERHDPTDTNGF